MISQRRLERVRPVDLGGFDQLVGNVVERAVHHDDPSAGAGPEGHDREDHGEVARRDRVVELRVAEPVQDERERASGRVEHEQPDDHARRAGESPGDVEEEAEHRANPLRQVVEHQDERHDEDGLTDQPDTP